MLADKARSINNSSKDFSHNHMSRYKVVLIRKGIDTMVNIKIDSQRRSMKGFFLLFVEPYASGTRSSEKYIFPTLKKVSITISGSPNMLYNEGIKCQDIWHKVSHFFMKEKSHTNLKKFYTKNNFGILIDLHSMASQKMHGSDVQLLNTTVSSLKSSRPAKAWAS